MSKKEYKVYSYRLNKKTVERLKEIRLENHWSCNILFEMLLDLADKFIKNTVKNTDKHGGKGKNSRYNIKPLASRLSVGKTEKDGGKGKDLRYYIK